MRFLVPVLLAAFALPAAAEERAYFDYRDWTTTVARVDTGEDVRIVCAAGTGGDGMPSLSIELSNGDVPPPDAFPPVMLRETAPRRNKTQMQDGQAVRFVFDDGLVLEGKVYGGFTEDGIAFAEAQVEYDDAQTALKAMRRARSLVVEAAGETVYTASLNGFTAAYGKMAEQCGFTTAGVID